MDDELFDQDCLIILAGWRKTLDNIEIICNINNKRMIKIGNKYYELNSKYQTRN
jgi:hypothetical protein